MMSILKIKKNLEIYYEIDNKTIGRVPSNSNLLPSGSDNSLYLGMTSNEQICDVICKMFGYENIMEFHNKNFTMTSHGGISVIVTTNINAEGQIQIKINKNGMMHDIFEEFVLNSMEDISPKDVIIVVDFKNLNVRVRKISDFEL